MTSVYADGSFPGQPASPTDASPDAGGQVNLIKLVHRVMRGRYMLALIAGALGAFAGGAGGWFSQTPKYKSEAIVRLQPVRQKLMGTSNSDELVPGFNQFAKAQLVYVQQERTLTKAMQSDEWRSLQRPVGAKAEKEFRDSLRVVSQFDTPEIILVSFTDIDAKASRIGVEQVTKSYEDIFGQKATKEKSARVQELENRKKQHEDDIASREKRIQQEISDLGSDDLEAEVKFQSERVRTTSAVMLELEMKLSGTNTTPRNAAQPLSQDPDGKTSPDEQPRSGDLTDEEIAGLDQTMSSYLQQRRAMEGDLNELIKVAGPDHRSVRRAKLALASLNEQIELFRHEFLKNRAAGAGNNLPIDGQHDTVERLQARLADVKQRWETYSQEAKRVNNKKQIVDGLRREISFLREQLMEVLKNIQTIRGDAAVQDAAGTIETILPQTTPREPTVDNRTRFAIVGFLFGGGVPISIIALIGLLNGKYRFSDEAIDNKRHAPLLGILPRLPQNLEDEEEATSAAHCVHQIRTLLQINAGTHKVYAVTSSTAGDGKTSLSLSLGLSFAASGVRTLMVDLDLIGQGLSRSLKKRPDEGIGIVLTSGQVGNQIVPVQIENLWLLPTARTDDRIASRLSQSMVGDLLEKLRAEYDVIIVDTGPVLGSLEANFASAVADGTILVVGQGQQRSHVQQAFAQLERLHAKTLGFVFNLASETDFRTSATTASFRSIRRDVPTAANPPVDFPDLDPLPRTVALDTRR